MGAKKKDADYLAEGEYWDSLSLEEIMAEAEPVDIEVVDRRRRKAISIRMDEDVLDATKQIATKLRIGYQTLMRIWIREGLERQRQRARNRSAGGKTRAA